MGMTLILGLLAGGGVFMFVDALRPRPPRIRLEAPDERPFLARLMETLFVPAGMRVARIGRHDWAGQRHDLAEQLARAGYPPPFTTPENVLGYQVFTAALFAGMVAIFGFILTLLVGSGVAGIVIPLAFVAALMGWTMPRQTLRNAENQRKEQLTLDAASALDRLAIYLSSGYALPVAVRDLAQRPGGAWIGEFRQIAAQYAVTGDFPAALERTGERNGRLLEITRVTDRMRAAYEMGGGGLAKSLRGMSEEARVRIRLLITERGHKNGVLMVVPALFALIGITLVLIAPGAVQMLWVLGG